VESIRDQLKLSWRTEGVRPLSSGWTESEAKESTSQRGWSRHTPKKQTHNNPAPANGRCHLSVSPGLTFPGQRTFQALPRYRGSCLGTGRIDRMKAAWRWIAALSILSLAAFFAP